MRDARGGVAALGAAAFITATAFAADITWTGGAGAGDKNWSTAANWSSALANPSTNRAIFTTTDTSPTVAKIVDVPWEVGGLRLTHNAGIHILNLGGNALTIGKNGELYVVASSAAAATTTVINGTVVLTNRIDVGNGAWLKITNGATLTGPFKNVFVGAAGNGYLDLRGGGTGGGVFQTDNMQIGGNNTAGEFYIGPGSLTTIRVTSNLFLNSTGAGGHQRGGARIGAPDPARGSQWYLPYGVSLYVGLPAARGRLHVHYPTSIYGGSDYSRLATTGGGAFEAWLTELLVSETWGTQDAGSPGTLDLRGMDSFLLDAQEARIGTSTSGGTVYSRGWVYFPAGTARFDRVYMGDSVNANSIALVDLSNTVCQINQRLDLKTSARITNALWGTSAGLDLSNDVILAFAGNAKIVTAFRQAPAPGVDPYWGIRWLGNHAAVLGGLVQGGTIALQIGNFTGSNDYKTGVYYDSGSGYTYAALVSNTVVLPPAVTARDISVEVDGESTIRIAPSDLVLAVYNPESLVETNRTLAYAGYLGGAEVPYIDFPTSGSLPITNANVTVKIYYQGGVTAEDTGDVLFTPNGAPTTNALTWAGLARNYSNLADRLQWKWGANWSGGQPPSNPTPATLTFDDTDNSAAVVKVLPPVPDIGGSPTGVWTVGSVRVGNLSGGHSLNLGGKTLRTTGEFRVQRLVASGTSALNVTNGTLDIGRNLEVDNANVALRAVDLRLAPTNSVNITGGSTVICTNGSTLSGAMNRLAIGTSGNGVLNLMDATIPGGELTVTDLQVGGGGAGSSGWLYLGSNTFTTIRVASNLFLNSNWPATGMQRGGGLIGWQNPARGTNWYLPRDVSIYIGTTNARGRLHVQRDDSTYGSASLSRLAVDTGGVFEAWLHDLTVGRTMGADEGGPTAVLDLRGLNSFLLNTTRASIGEDGATRGTKAQVNFPSGSAQIGTLIMGRPTNPAPINASYAILDLNDTIATVTNSAALNGTAQITINVSSNRASGLELPGLPVVSNGASVRVTFLAPPTHGQLHYGLKVAGNTMADLQGAAWLSWNDAALPPNRKAAIFKMGAYTYVGLPPPAGSIFMVR